MPTVLERIVLAKKEELRRRRDEEPLAALRQRVADLQAQAVGRAVAGCATPCATGRADARDCGSSPR